MLSQTWQLGHAAQTQSFAKKTHILLSKNTRFSLVSPYNQLCIKKKDKYFLRHSKPKKANNKLCDKSGQIMFSQITLQPGKEGGEGECTTTSI